jgi:hypothetical protein
LNLATTFDHLKFSIFAGLANALGERRTRLYLVENLLAFLAISLRGVTALSSVDRLLHLRLSDPSLRSALAGVSADLSMPDFVQMLQLPHWLMLAGLSLVIAGCIGLALGRKSAAEIDDEPINETNPEPPPQMPPLPRRLDSRRRAERNQHDFPDE